MFKNAILALTPIGHMRAKFKMLSKIQFLREISDICQTSSTMTLKFFMNIENLFSKNLQVYVNSAIYSQTS